MRSANIYFTKTLFLRSHLPEIVSSMNFGAFGGGVTTDSETVIRAQVII